MALHRLIQFRLHDMLHAKVNGKTGVQSVSGGDVLMAQGNHLTLARIGFSNPPTAGAGEPGIQHRLDALFSVMIGSTYETKHVRSQSVSGIHTELILLTVGKNRLTHAGQHLALFTSEAGFIHSEIELLQIRRNFLPFLPRHFPLEYDITIRTHLPGIALKQFRF